MRFLPISLETDMAELRITAEAAFAQTSDSSLDEWFSFVEMERSIQLNRGACFKAIDDAGQILGMIYAQPENPINSREGLDKWVIVILAVKPTAKNQGIGSGLLQTMEQHVAAVGAHKLFVYTNHDDADVIRFYQKNGYAHAGSINEYQYGRNNTAVFLLKHLL